MPTDPPALLREEAHHRFFNTLTALRALLRRDFAGLEDVQVKAAVAAFDAQLMAFAGVHRDLRASPLSSVVDVPVYFGRIFAQLAAAQLSPFGLQCAFFADEGEMDLRTGERLALILVELVTNAAKHAFVGRTGGRVSVDLRRSEGCWIGAVRDNGVGLQRGRAGSGLDLIDSLARGIGAAVTTASDTGGTTVTLRIPLDAQHAAPDLETRDGRPAAPPTTASRRPVRTP